MSSEPDNNLMADVVAATGLPEGVVKGICGQLAASGRHRKDRAVLMEQAQTWGVGFQQVELLASLKLENLQAITDGVANAALMNCAVAQKHLARVLNSIPSNKEQLDAMKAFSAVAKQQNDMALGWLKQQGPSTLIQNNYNVSDIQQLKEIREREAPAAERLRRLGVVLVDGDEGAAWVLA